MAVSQNGWSAVTSPNGVVPLPWITGRVRPGDVFIIFSYLCTMFNAHVETITRAHSWGWYYRVIRNATSLSNHSSGTAIDLNAPRHVLGRRGTFSAAQVREIRAILSYLEGVVRWGGDYSGRADEMHFEINASAEAVRRVAAKIRGEIVSPTPQNPVPIIPVRPVTPPPTIPEEVEDMGPYILVAPDSRWFFIVAGSPKPTAVQVGKDTANHPDKPLASLPIFRIKEQGTWDRLQKAYAWVNA